MRLLTVAVTALVGLMWLSFAYFASGAAIFENPAAPLPEMNSTTYPQFDVQIHSRDYMPYGTMEPVVAQHADNCDAPPLTHSLNGTSRAAYAFVCRGHVMTALHEGGYGAIAITPVLQIVGTSATVTWNMSTEAQSARDWVDVWITPWADNLTEPADIGAVDLQGVPRQGIHIKSNMGDHGWCVRTIRNYIETDYRACGNLFGTIHDGITPGTNEAAVRQDFRIIVTPTNLRFERLASATATGVVYYDGPADVPNIDGAVVQFEHHSYNPEKDGSCDTYMLSTGLPCGPTWHWQNMDCSPCIPFTLIRPNVTELYNNGGTQTITFPPAPAGARLRFTGLGGVVVNGQLAPKQANLNGAGHGAPYFLPLTTGATSATFSFQTDDWYTPNFGMSVQDIAIWAQGSAPIATPTPTSVVPTPTNTPIVQPTATNTPIVQPTTTNTPVQPTPTASPLPPTATPNAPTQVCTVRWGNGTVVNLGQQTQIRCAQAQLP